MEGSERNIYVVMGATGEYSDRQEWPVRAFLSVLDAKRLIVEAEAEARRIGVFEEDVHIPFDTRHSAISSVDKGMKVDYNGVSYFYMVVPLAGPSETFEQIIKEDHSRRRAIKLTDF